MIFIVLGTQKFQLDRLLKEVDRLIGTGVIKDKVKAQLGNSTYRPENMEWVEFMDKEEFDNNVKAADLLITHSGVGTIITALSAKKPVIVYPRLKKYGEHVDDHQLDIAKAFEKKKYVLCCYETDSLEEKIREAETFKFEEYVSQREKMVGVIQDYLDTL